MSTTAQRPNRAHGPAQPATRIRYRTAAVPLLVGLLGLTISLAGIGVPSVWYDEAATIISSTRSWAELGQMIGTVDAVHALYYAMMHVVFDVFGYSPVSLRVPSAVATAIAGALTVILGRQLGRPRTAAVAGIVFCLLPRTTWMGTEGRSYAMTAVLAVALTVVLVHAMRHPSRRWWVVYGAVVILSCLLFIYLALVVVAHAITVVWWMARDGRPARTAARAWIVATASATVLILPFAALVMGESKQLHWLKPLGHSTVQQVFRDQWFFDSVPFAVVGWALLVVGAVRMLRRRPDDTGRVRLSSAVVLLPALLLPTVALLTATGLYLPIYTPRYLTMCVPFVALVMAAALDTDSAGFRNGAVSRLAGRFAARIPAAPRGAVAGRIRSTAVAVIALAILTALAAPQIVAQRQPEAKERSSWAAVADLIARERATDTPGTTTAILYGSVQYHPIATTRVIAYSYPDAFRDTIDVTLGTPAAQTGALWETRRPLEDSLGRLTDADVTYLITSFARDRRADTTRILAGAGWHVDGEWDLSKVHVVRYER